ncbi:MAG: stage V sporulation protein G [Planctomycetaceae bacterium]|jgi:stage V sporulation protein G|nr:stage V sporulation protein G [Planctomycetaceae bacterium]
MEITEVRIKLTEDSDDRLQAFCSITFDDSFVVRDLKIIEGTNGPFVAMPSRKLTGHCPRCRSKNHLRANYCNQCGAKTVGDGGSRDHDGRAKLYADIAHPINSTCREMIQNRVIEEYEGELDLAKQPGYVSRYEDDYDDVFVADYEEPAPATKPQETRKTEIQPSELGLKAPHTATPSSQPQQAATKHSKPQAQRDGFGAGILED